MTCPDCEHHKNRAARWRAEAYKHIGYDIELPWVGLTDELEALFTNIDHAISSGAWNMQKGSQTWEIIEHAKAALGIKEKNT